VTVTLSCRARRGERAEDAARRDAVQLGADLGGVRERGKAIDVDAAANRTDRRAAISEARQRVRQPVGGHTKLAGLQQSQRIPQREFRLPATQPFERGLREHPRMRQGA
jgi:hypothetical protein